jgi:hypothetical protein
MRVNSSLTPARSAKESACSGAPEKTNNRSLLTFDQSAKACVCSADPTIVDLTLDISLQKRARTAPIQQSSISLLIGQ